MSINNGIKELYLIKLEQYNLAFSLFFGKEKMLSENVLVFGGNEKLT